MAATGTNCVAVQTPRALTITAFIMQDEAVRGWVGGRQVLAAADNMMLYGWAKDGSCWYCIGGAGSAAS